MNRKAKKERAAKRNAERHETNEQIRQDSLTRIHEYQNQRCGVRLRRVVDYIEHDYNATVADIIDIHIEKVIDDGKKPITTTFRLTGIRPTEECYNQYVYVFTDENSTELTAYCRKKSFLKFFKQLYGVK